VVEIKEDCCKECGGEHSTSKSRPVKTKITSMTYQDYGNGSFELYYHVDASDCIYYESWLFKTRKEALIRIKETMKD